MGWLTYMTMMPCWVMSWDMCEYADCIGITLEWAGGMQIYDYGCQNLDNGTVQLFIQVLSGLLALVVLHRMNHFKQTLGFDSL